MGDCHTCGVIFCWCVGGEYWLINYCQTLKLKWWQSSQATMWVLSHFSKRHTWLLPVFAMGLGAPRWCQILWGTSGAALYIPWAGGAGPYFGSRWTHNVVHTSKARLTFWTCHIVIVASLWLWLGVLDAIQGVGLGMILLQTLSRVHVAATLCMAQIIGSTTVLVARATAPDRIGPANVFPNLALYDPHEPIKGSVLGHWEFWVALACQLIIVVGYSFFFRREVRVSLLLTESTAFLGQVAEVNSFACEQQLSKPWTVLSSNFHCTWNTGCASFNVLLSLCDSKIQSNVSLKISSQSSIYFWIWFLEHIT